MAEDQGKKTGFLREIYQNVGSLGGALFGVDRLAHAFKPENIDSTMKTINSFRDVNKAIRSQFGTSLFGLDLKDETNADRARKILSQRQGGQEKCMVLDAWLATLSRGDINRFNQMIAEHFNDYLTVFTIVLEEVLPSKASVGVMAGEKKDDQGTKQQRKKKKQAQAPSQQSSSRGQKFSPQEISKLVKELANDSEEILDSFAEPAADALERFADLPSDESRNVALKAAHLKRDGWFVVEEAGSDQKFIEDAPRRREASRQRLNNTLMELKEAYRRK